VDYSSVYWGDHVSGTAAEAEHWVINFLNMERNVESAVQTMTISKNISWPLHSHRKYPNDFFGIHLAVFFGLNKIVAILLEDGYDPDVKDSHGKTPLMWAAERNKEEVIMLF
jgi:ankyrin repeat protein